MINTLTHRIKNLSFVGHDDLHKLQVLSNCAIAYLKGKLKIFNATAEMAECISKINAALEKDYPINWGNDKFIGIKSMF